MGAPKPLTINEWMAATKPPMTNRRLERLTEIVDPEGKGVADGTIRGVRKGYGCTMRVGRLIVEASERQPAIVDGKKCSIFWKTLYAL